MDRKSKIDFRYKIHRLQGFTNHDPSMQLTFNPTFGIQNKSQVLLQDYDAVLEIKINKSS